MTTGSDGDDPSRVAGGVTPAGPGPGVDVDVVDADTTPIDAAGQTPPRQAGRSVAGSAVVTALSNAVLPLTSLATGPLLARALGPEGRGEMAAVLAPLFVAAFVAAAGLPEASTYAIARLGVAPRRVAVVSSGILLLTGTATAAGMAVFASTIVAGSPQVAPTLRLTLPALPFLMIALNQRFAASGARRYRLVAVERTTAALGRLLLLVGLLVTGLLTARTGAWSNVISTLLAAAVLAVPLLRARTGRTTMSSGRLARTLLGYGLRGWGGVFANLVNWRLDQALLAGFVSARNLGYYAVAVSLAELPSMILGATKSVVFSESSARSDLWVAARAARIVLVVAVVVDVVLAVTAPLAVRLLFGESFAPATPLTRILLLANIPFTTEVILASGLLAAGRPGLRSLSQAIGAGVTVLGLAVMVPRLGTLGAALTSLTAYSITLTVTAVLFTRVSGLPVRSFLVPQRADVLWARVQLAGALRRLRRRNRIR